MLSEVVLHEFLPTAVLARRPAAKICLAEVTSRREVAPRYKDREQDRSRARSGRVSRRF